MKCQIPQISWHNRDPVLSIDFQSCSDGINRLATAGTDTHVLLWHVTIQDGGNITNDFVADLTRHTKAVNIVRFSPNGEILASGDDEAAIFLWKQQPVIAHDIFAENDNNKENWNVLRVLRGHLNDVCDLSWSADSNSLISGSVDNTAIIWDIHKGRNSGPLQEHKGFVQGVAWDPLGQYLATLCSDRILRIYNPNTNKVICKVQKAVLKQENAEGAPKSERIFYDDTLKSFCRRLSFSPDGNLLIVPSGICEESGAKINNATYVFARNSFNKPVLCLPTGDSFTLATRCCPILFELRKNDNGDCSEMLFSLPYRIIFAVATQNSILLYDTQQSIPFAHISNLHYTRLSDIAWSSDGRLLVASSTDGYCSFIVFSEGELGKPYQKEKENIEPNVSLPKQKENILDQKSEENTSMDWNLVLEPSTSDCPTFSNAAQSTEKINIEDKSEKIGPTVENKSERVVITIEDKSVNPIEEEKSESDVKKSKKPCKGAKIQKPTPQVENKDQRRIQLTTIKPKLDQEASGLDVFVKPVVPELSSKSSSASIKKPRRVQLITLSQNKNEPDSKS